MGLALGIVGTVKAVNTLSARNPMPRDVMTLIDQESVGLW